MKILLAAAGAIALGGCVQHTAPKQVWVRVDGQPIRGNPKLEQQGEIDKTICLGETQKSAVGMVPIYYRGIGGAVNASIIEGQRQSALLDVAKGCMAERGYLLTTEEEAAARAAFAASRAKPRTRASSPTT